MQQQTTPEAIRLILEQTRAWFGLPPITFNGKRIDGRIRFREAVAMRIPIPAEIKVTVTGDAVRLLCVAGHYQRAKELLPQALLRVDDAAAFCACPREIVAPMFIKPKRARGKWESRYAHRRAIEQMSRLLRAAELTDGTVTAEEIRGVLRPWL